MQDPWNPQRIEIKAWAYDPDSCWPDQDFDLSVAEIYFGDLILDLVADEKCPKRDFFLRCAYLLVGDSVWTDYRTRTKEEVEQFIENAKAKNNEMLSLLYTRSVELINDKSLFDYLLWCSGGYVDEES